MYTLFLLCVYSKTVSQYLNSTAAYILKTLSSCILYSMLIIFYFRVPLVHQSSEMCPKLGLGNSTDL